MSALSDEQRARLVEVMAQAIRLEAPYTYLGKWDEPNPTWIVYEVQDERSIALSRWRSLEAAKGEVKRLESAWLADAAIAAAERAGFRIEGPE